MKACKKEWIGGNVSQMDFFISDPVDTCGEMGLLVCAQICWREQFLLPERRNNIFKSAKGKKLFVVKLFRRPNFLYETIFIQSADARNVPKFFHS
jgi:hypothetical protein